MLYACGSNSGGQLGVGHREDALRTLPCKYFREAVSNDSWELEPDHPLADRFPPPGWKVKQLSGGANHTVAILEQLEGRGDERQLWFAGEHTQGQRGLGARAEDDDKGDPSDTVFVRVDYRRILRSASSGVADVEALRPKLIAAGWDNTFVVFEGAPDSGRDDVVLALGLDNQFGQLGLPRGKPSSRANLVELPQSDGGRRVITALAAGLRHVLIHVTDESCKKHAIYGWGASRKNQLDWEPTQSPQAVQWGPKLVHAWEAERPGTTVQLAAGKAHSAVLITTESSHDSCLRILRQTKSDEMTGVLALGACWNNTVTLRSIKGSSKNDINIDGSNSKGQHGVGHLEDVQGTSSASIPMKYHVLDIACGSEHVLALVSERGRPERKVVGWGWNEHGNLGTGSGADLPYPTTISTDQTASCQAIWAGCGTTFVQALVDPYRAVPKVELHAHLNGSIRRSTLAELARDAGLDDKAAHILENDARSLSEMFEVFDVIHKAVKGPKTVRRIAREMMEDMAADGVVYAEIRTTPKADPLYEDYIEAVLNGMQDYAYASRRDPHRTIGRLLLSIDRGGKLDPTGRSTEGEVIVCLAWEFMCQGVVGIDLSGNPTKGQWSHWKKALKEARECGLKIALHAGEVPDKDEEMKEMLDFHPERMGHVCFMSSENEKRLMDSDIAVELCLTSNVLSNSVASYDAHHFKKYLHAWREAKAAAPGSEAAGPSFSICTDDSAVFGSSSSDELAIIHNKFPEENITWTELRAIGRNAMRGAFLEPGKDRDYVLRRLSA